LTTDYFAALKEPRRPWLEAETLKRRFLALSAEIHPDRVHNQSTQEKESAHRRYLEVHAAYECLREPKTRLRHLLELEQGGRLREVDTVPPDLLELFMDVSRVSRQVDAFLAERDKMGSPLLKAQHFSRGLQHEREVAALRSRIEARQEALVAELRAIDVTWSAAEGPGSVGRGPPEDPPHGGGPEQAAFLAGTARMGGGSKAHESLRSRLEEMYRLFSYFARWTGQLAEQQFQLVSKE